MPKARPRAVVFDMDGTLVFNMRWHTQAWLEVARAEGIPGVTAEYVERELAGMKNEELIPRLVGRPVSHEELVRIAEAKESRYRELYAPKLEPAPGLLALLHRLDAEGVAYAVATAAPERNRELVLDGLGLRPRFVAVVGAEGVARGKPAPDLFLAVAAKIAIEPEACVVFEDAPNGVRAALAAGMPCVGVASTVPADMLVDAGAEAVIDAFDPLPAAVQALLFGAAR